MSTTQATTLSTAFNKSSTSPAVIIPQTNKTYSYKELFTQVHSFQSQLARFGVEPRSAVSIALPNTLEFIVSFIAVTNQRAIAAPLNPAYTQTEFEFYIDDIKSVLLIVPRGAVKSNAEAVKAARKYGAGMVEVWVDEESGEVQVELVEKGKLEGAQEQKVTEGMESEVALVLHTSGTTGKPKGVPLTHKNLTRTMHNVVNTYKLSPSDRTYLVMPLFHVHGLLAAFLSPLHSGGSVVVPPGFSARQFWPDFIKYKANWYSAVPSMNSILLKSPAPDPVPKIRFIRSCSSPLAPSIFHKIESTFKAPVLEAYAMTEAAHQMTSNPLPPATRKPGSVGLPQGVEVAILPIDASSNTSPTPLPHNTSGEICIKGPNVTPGYINNPAANASSFTSNGYFRTGDQGYLDNDGYVFITGRIKELINRGGEKISPIEIDSAMLAHPDVSEAVSFGIDDEVMGQEVGAAVVFKQGSSNGKDEEKIEELKTFLKSRLAKFKIPKKIYATEVMPKTATGKIQRIKVREAMEKESKKRGAKL